MKSEQIYQEIVKTGGSGRGVSYWTVPAMCGRKRTLMTEHPTVDTIIDHTALNTGIYYHVLKEWFYSGRIPEGTVLDMDPVSDPEWGEAVRLFNWSAAEYPRDYWGQVVAVELKMPINEDHAQKVIEWVGHDESTGACDLVVKMSDADVSRINADRGIELPGPGIYIIDHKTSGARKSDTDAKAYYTSSMQSLKYMHMLGLAFNEPVRGMVFDVLVKHKNLRRVADGRNGSSVQTFIAYPRLEDAKVVKAAIDYGMWQRDANKANPFACYDHGRECVFLSRGLCGRY
jgi:hypothetical protein